MRIAIILVIIGLVFGAVFYGYNQNQKKMRMEAAALAAEIEGAQQEYDSIVGELAGLEEFSPEVWSVMTTASNLVPGIVGSANAPRVYDRDYGKKKPVAVKQPTPAKPGDKPSEPAKPAVKTGVVVDEFGREAPAGFVTREMEKKKQELEAARKNPGGGSTPAATPSTTGDSKLEGRIKRAQDLLEKIKESCFSVEGRIQEAAYISTQSATILAAVKAAPTAFRASKERVGFKELVPMAKGLKRSIVDEIAAAEKILPQLEAMKAEVEAEEQVAADAAARKREAEEREARRKREMAAVQDWYGDQPQRIRVFDFTAIVDDLKGRQRSYTFEEAQKILDVPIQRYDLAAKALVWLRGEFNKAPLSWGWKTAGGALDIERADEQGIYVQEKLIAWTKIPKPRLMGFFSHYLKKSEDVGKSKADLYIGAAVLAKTFDEEDFVDEFIDKAEIESDVAARSIPAIMNFKIDDSVIDD